MTETDDSVIRSKFGSNFERILSIGSALMALIALVLSLQANQIAQEMNAIMLKQTSEQVVAVNASYVSARYDEAHQEFSCTQQIRLANVGGAGASIIRYEATLWFQGMSTSIAGEQAYPLNSSQLGQLFSGFRIDFIDSNAKEQRADPSKFPINIGPFTTIDIFSSARFSVNTTLQGGNYFYPPYDYYSFMEPGSKAGDLTPVEISFTFETATGKRVASTPHALCVYIR